MGMDRSMDGWMHGCTDGWMDGCLVIMQTHHALQLHKHLHVVCTSEKKHFEGCTVCHCVLHTAGYCILLQGM